MTADLALATKPRSRRRALRLLAAIRRPATAAAVALAAVLLGWIAALFLGRGFHPAVGEEMQGYGQIVGLRLPRGARTLDELTSFEVEMNGADDFARVYVNNYIIIHTESPDNVLLFAPPDNAQQKIVRELAVKRNMPAPGKKEAVQFLQRGLNEVVLENENSIFGACTASISFWANGQRLEHFPYRIPKNLYPERLTVKSELIGAFEQFGRVPTNDEALCGRRLFVFRLQ